jgi:hypothetical protein
MFQLFNKPQLCLIKLVMLPSFSTGMIAAIVKSQIIENTHQRAPSFGKVARIAVHLGDP